MVGVCVVPVLSIPINPSLLICLALLALGTASHATAQMPIERFDGGLVISAAVTDDDAANGSTPAQNLTAAACAGAYHAALSGISDVQGEALQRAIKSAKTGWRKLTGRWLFPPRRSVKDKPFRAVVRRAARLVRRRGIDPKLKNTVQTQPIARMATDLKVYVGQRAAPALCTGATNYMDFFDGQLAPFHMDRDSAADLFERAAQVADRKLGEAQRLLSTPLDLRGDEDTDTLEASARELSRLHRIARATWSTIADADATPGLLVAHVSALSRSRAALKRIRLKRRSPLRAPYLAVYTAFTALEALTYIQASHAKHQEIAAGFGDTISAVRAAHSKICVCAK